jgi:hypothetical protein
MITAVQTKHGSHVYSHKDKESELTSNLQLTNNSNHHCNIVVIAKTPNGIDLITNTDKHRQLENVSYKLFRPNRLNT